MIIPFSAEASGGGGGGIGRGLFFGGYGGSSYPVKSIDYVTIASTGNAADFGDMLFSGALYVHGCASSTRGIITGGDQNKGLIEYVTVASAGDATDFGDLTVDRYACAVLSSSTRGCVRGGYDGTGGTGFLNTIDYVTIASTGNATDFGDAIAAVGYGSGCASPTRGIMSAGITTSFVNIDSIEYITIASTGNGTDFGDLGNSGPIGGSASNATRGLIVHGKSNNVVEYITIASTGNATDFGDASSSLQEHPAACADATRALVAGGQAGAYLDTIEYFTIASTGNSTDFGDLTTPYAYFGGLSDAHGGLG